MACPRSIPQMRVPPRCKPLVTLQVLLTVLFPTGPYLPTSWPRKCAAIDYCSWPSKEAAAPEPQGGSRRGLVVHIIVQTLFVS